MLVDCGADRPKVLVTEADLIDYPGLWLRASQDAPGLDGLFAAFPLEEKVIGSEYPQAVVVQRASYIAETNGRRAYPWRVLAIADRDADLPANDIVYRLGGTTRARRLDRGCDPARASRSGSGTTSCTTSRSSRA